MHACCTLTRQLDSEKSVTATNSIKKLKGDDLTLTNILKSMDEGEAESYGVRRDRCQTFSSSPAKAAVIDVPDRSTELGLIRHESKSSKLSYPAGQV